MLITIIHVHKSFIANQKTVKINIVIFSYILVLVSCSKSEIEAPAVVPPKLLKEIKIVNGGSSAPSDSTVTTFEYNDKSQLIKKTDKLEPGNYQVYEYNGDMLVSMKNYYKGSLVQSLTNPVILSGNKIIYTIVNTPAAYTPDTVLLQYSFDGTNMTEYKTTLLYPGSSSSEYIQGYTYTANSLSGTNYTSFLDGVQAAQGQTYKVGKLDDKFNPYSTQTAMNKTLMAIGQQIAAHGQHNVLEATLVDPNVGLSAFTYTYDADGFATSRRKLGDLHSSETYSYTR